MILFEFLKIMNIYITIFLYITCSFIFARNCQQKANILNPHQYVLYCYNLIKINLNKSNK